MYYSADSGFGRESFHVSSLFASLFPRDEERLFSCSLATSRELTFSDTSDVCHIKSAFSYYLVLESGMYFAALPQMKKH